VTGEKPAHLRIFRVPEITARSCRLLTDPTDTANSLVGKNANGQFLATTFGVRF
jgi:hypothetical protein